MPENITPDDLPEIDDADEAPATGHGVQAGPMPRSGRNAAVDSILARRAANLGEVSQPQARTADVLANARAAVANTRRVLDEVRAARQGGVSPRRAVGPAADSVQAALADVHRAVADMRAENELHTSDTRRGRPDPVRAERIARTDAAIDAAEARERGLVRQDHTRAAVEAMARTMDAQARQISALRRGRFDDTPQTDSRGRRISAAGQRHIQAFNAYARSGEDAGMRQVMAALTTREDTGGGFFIPEEWDRTMSGLLLNSSVMRQIATVRTIGGPLLKMAKNLNGTDAAWIGETTAPTETNTSTMAELSFTVMEMAAFPKISQQLLEDASTDLEAWIAEEVQEAFSILENPAFITGTGANQPRGLLSYGMKANATVEGAPGTYWGNFGYIVTGVSGGWAASNPSDILIDMEYALRPAARPNASWLINRALVAEIRKFKDTTGEYIWQKGLQAGQPSLLLNYPLYEDDYMPAKGADSYSLGFGDWRKTYLVLDRLGSTVLRDPYTAKPYVMFYTRKRVGGGVKEFQYAKFLKFGTS
jgi:HK97 family phage major capsid protein